MTMSLFTSQAYQKPFKLGFKNHSLDVSTNKLLAVIENRIKTSNKIENTEKLTIERHKHNITEEISQYGS